MYGMVNKAVADLVCGQFGEEAWQRIKTRAGVETDVFIGTEPYPDELTYRLVAAAAEELRMAPSAILEAFGEHWVLKTAREGYGSLLASGGKSLPEFLVNLPHFHSRIMLMFPKLRPPEFRVSDVKPDSLRLWYMSHRPGLEPFVVGLVQGLGKMFNTPARVRHVAGTSGDGTPVEFLVEWTGGVAS